MNVKHVIVVAGLWLLMSSVVAGNGPIWPLSGSDQPDADVVNQPYGPRWIGRYDFHAGIDIPAPIGTPILSVLPGTVIQVRPWDGVTIGPGNAVLVDHGDGRFGSYLHLDTIGVEVGQELQQGEPLGTVGRTGANSPHLHFGLMIDLPGNSVDERRSRNPLELLPHTAPEALSEAAFPDEHRVVLQVPVRTMTIRSIRLTGREGEERLLDYYAVVAKGITPRREQEQDGFFIETAAAQGGLMPLTLSLLEPKFAIARIVVTDIHDRIILNQLSPDMLPGDANGDGRVDIADLGILAANWQQAGFWSTGDFNGDAVVNIADLGILASNWQAGVGGMSFEEALGMFDALAGVVVPEPAAALCLFWGAAALRRRQNR
jgi:hypothetical protein